MSDPLGALARRVVGDPFFLAPLLEAYARSEGVGEAGLASALGCAPETLTALRLCRAPRADAEGFREDLDVLSAYFGLDWGRLAGVVRRGQVVRRLGAAGGVEGTLLAARDAPAPEGEGP